jgi:hypothetical protein
MSIIFEAANWWEPGQNGTLDIGDISAIFMFLLALIGSAVASSRWLLKKIHVMIRNEVEEFTKQIQPSANGGLSLPDVSRKVDVLETMLCDMKESNEETKGMLTKLLLNIAIDDIDEKKPKK